MKTMTFPAMRSLLALGALACVTAGTLGAQNTTAPSTDARAAGRAALRYAVADSAAEIQMCHLAQSKSSSEGIKNFCSRMISDHTAMENQAQLLARQNGAGAIALAPSDEGTITLAYLQTLNGKDFEQEFLKAQVDDHRNDIETLRNALQASQNDQEKAFLQQTLAKLDEHLKLANDTLNQISR